MNTVLKKVQIPATKTFTKSVMQVGTKLEIMYIIKSMITLKCYPVKMDISYSIQLVLCTYPNRKGS